MSFLNQNQYHTICHNVPSLVRSTLLIISNFRSYKQKNIYITRSRINSIRSKADLSVNVFLEYDFECTEYSVHDFRYQLGNNFRLNY